MTNPFIEELERCLEVSTPDSDAIIDERYQRVAPTLGMLQPLITRLRRHEQIFELQVVFDGQFPTPEEFHERKRSLSRQLESEHATTAMKEHIKMQLDRMHPFTALMEKHASMRSAPLGQS